MMPEKASSEITRMDQIVSPTEVGFREAYTRNSVGFAGGPDRDRTGYLRHAMAARRIRPPHKCPLQAVKVPG
jgi:hypothetical protein